MAQGTIELMEEPQVKTVEVTLEVGDTCDHCGPGVEALVAVMLRSGKLAFCRHHYNRYAAALAPLILGFVEKVIEHTKPVG